MSYQIMYVATDKLTSQNGGKFRLCITRNCGRKHLGPVSPTPVSG